ncbi:MAG: thiol:disulfide interchange protein DsbA/DsbL [Pasteurellaceae bacterium]|nr:thiol:disulfide interchange protein DsbA/DsbL [Pasteurellaceae bacterium]
MKSNCQKYSCVNWQKTIGFLTAVLLFLHIHFAIAEPELDIQEQQSIAQPEFMDGKDYFSYSTSINESPRSDKKIVVKSFFDYDCRTCVNTRDILAVYGQINAGKVVIEDYPVATDETPFTAQVYYTLAQMKQDDLSDALLFETSDPKRYQQLSQYEKLLEWLDMQGVDTNVFDQIYHSEKIKNQVDDAVAQTEKYGVFTYPFVVIDGTYALTESTLYNDDYTFAVLDALVKKIQMDKPH